MLEQKLQDGKMLINKNEKRRRSHYVGEIWKRSFIPIPLGRLPNNYLSLKDRQKDALLRINSCGVGLKTKLIVETRLPTLFRTLILVNY